MSIYKRGSTYWVNVVDPRSGRQVRKSTHSSDRSTAKEQESHLRLELGRGTIFEIRAAPKQVSFDQLMSEFLAHQKIVGRKSLKTFFEKNVTMLLQWFKSEPVDQITARDIEHFRVQRCIHVKPGTVNRNLAVLRRAMNLAKRWGYIKSNPVEGIEMLKEPRGRIRYLNPGDQKAVLGVCRSPNLRDYVLVAMRTGMRRGELSRLRVADVDLSRAVIVIHQSKTDFPRHVPLSKDVLEIMKRRCEDQPKHLTVFRNKKGGPLHSWAFRTAWNTVRRKAGIADFRVHDLRHVFATDCLSGGASLAGVGAVLGHRSTKTTAIYAHVTQDLQREVIEKLDAYHDTVHSTVVGRGDLMQSS